MYMCVTVGMAFDFFLHTTINFKQGVLLRKQITYDTQYMLPVWEYFTNNAAFFMARCIPYATKYN